MNKLKFYAMLLLTLAFLSGCGGSDAGSEGGDSSGASSSSAEGEADIDDANSAVSTWDGHSLREEADKGSKWLASVSFGEKVELLGDSKEGPDGKYTFENVRLLDGKEGWVRDDLIHKGGKYGVVTKMSQIYKRPSVSNITDKSVDRGTLVVIKQNSDEFVEFIAQNDKSNNRQRGWVLGNSAISSDEIDIAVAVMINKAKAEKVPAKRKQTLETITGNDAYQNSTFYQTAVDMLGAADQPPVELNADQLMITGDNVNVRSDPDVDAGEKLFQLNSGDVVGITEKGDMDEIGGNLDYWYKIDAPGKGIGWVFGQFTSKSLNE